MVRSVVMFMFQSFLAICQRISTEFAALGSCGRRLLPHCQINGVHGALRIHIDRARDVCERSLFHLLSWATLPKLKWSTFVSTRSTVADAVFWFLANPVAPFFPIPAAKSDGDLCRCNFTEWCCTFSNRVILDERAVAVSNSPQPSLPARSRALVAFKSCRHWQLCLCTMLLLVDSASAYPHAHLYARSCSNIAILDHTFWILCATVVALSWVLAIRESRRDHVRTLRDTFRNAVTAVNFAALVVATTTLICWWLTLLKEVPDVLASNDARNLRRFFPGGRVRYLFKVVLISSSIFAICYMQWPDEFTPHVAAMLLTAIVCIASVGCIIQEGYFQFGAGNRRGHDSASDNDGTQLDGFPDARETQADTFGSDEGSATDESSTAAEDDEPNRASFDQPTHV